MPFEIPTTAIVLLVLAFIVFILSVPIFKSGTSKKEQNRKLIVFSMSHYVGNNHISFADFEQLHLNIPKDGGIYYFCCNSKNIEVYQSLEGALSKTTSDSYSVLEVTITSAPLWSISIRQVTEESTGIRTDLGYGITVAK